jgi:hypothetical protein
MATTVIGGASPSTIMGLIDQLRALVKKQNETERRRLKSPGKSGMGGITRHVKRFSSESELCVQDDLLRASAPSLMNLLKVRGKIL